MELTRRRYRLAFMWLTDPSGTAVVGRGEPQNQPETVEKPPKSRSKSTEYRSPLKPHRFRAYGFSPAFGLPTTYPAARPFRPIPAWPAAQR